MAMFLSIDLDNLSLEKKIELRKMVSGPDKLKLIASRAHPNDRDPIVNTMEGSKGKK